MWEGKWCSTICRAVLTIEERVVLETKCVDSLGQPSWQKVSDDVLNSILTMALRETFNAVQWLNQQNQKLLIQKGQESLAESLTKAGPKATTVEP